MHDLVAALLGCTCREKRKLCGAALQGGGGLADQFLEERELYVNRKTSINQQLLFSRQH